MLNKDRLIKDLKNIHSEIVLVYEDIFLNKYKNDNKFSTLIEQEYKKVNITDNEDKIEWNKKYYHRSAYTLINKILFIRICEDKGFMLNDDDKVMGEEINQYSGQKLSMIGLQKWSELISNYSLSELVKFAFKDMYKSYNSIPLYKEDKYDWLLPNEFDLESHFLEDKSRKSTLYKPFEALLKKIIETLDTSRYNFGDSSDNVLGDVYEKFMDRETRKALGQFYTPDYVIKDILDRTIENIDVIERPFVKVLDPACGSGHFLIMAYDMLKLKFAKKLNQLREKYVDTKYTVKIKGEYKEVSGEKYWTEEFLHYHILKHCLYGADIDEFAIQLTTINLLLKDLDNVFSDELNIIECDSLIKWDMDYDWKKLKDDLNKDNLFLSVNHLKLDGKWENIDLSWDDALYIVNNGEFWSQDFDYIVGNPPYLTIALGRGQGVVLDKSKETYYKSVYKNSAQYKVNLFALFLELAIEKVKDNGEVSFIVPSSILTNYYFKDIRKYILNNTEVEVISKLDYDVFDGAVTGGNTIFVLKKTTPNDEVKTTCITAKTKEELINSDEKIETIEQRQFLNLPEMKFLIDKKIVNIINDIKKNTIKLNDLVTFYNGIKTGDNKRFLSEQKLDNKYKPILRGRDIYKYTHNFRGNYVLFDKDLLWSNTNEEMYLVDKKIIVRQTSDRIVATLDEEQYFTMDTTHLIIPNNEENIYFLLGILNSKFIHFFYSQIVPETDKAFAEVKISNLKELPIKLGDSKKTKSISENTKNILNLYKSYNEKIQFLKDTLVTLSIQDLIQYQQQLDLIKVKIDNYISVIDEEVFDLYEIAPETKEKIFMYINENVNKNSFEELKQILPIEGFIEEHINNQKTLEDMTNEYNCRLVDIYELREQYAELLKNNEENYLIYNSLDIDQCIRELFIERIQVIVSNKRYVSLEQLVDGLSKSIGNFSELIKVLKKTDETKKDTNVLKEIINDNSQTFNQYIKNRKGGKKNRIFTRYDSAFVGLSSWTDENHSKFFIDLLMYYAQSKEESNQSIFSRIRPSKAKANTSLNILKQLEFADKDDYVELLTEKINKAFE